MRDLAIRNTHSAVVTIRGDKAFDQDDNPITLDQSLVDAEITRLQTIYDNNQYQRDRLKEYPSIEECVHAILDGELDALQAKRKIVKERHPKGGN